MLTLTLTGTLATDGDPMSTDRTNLTLQELFVRSRGRPVVLDGVKVFQMARIPIAYGNARVLFRFLGEPTGRHGLIVKANKGFVRLPNGKQVGVLKIWDEPGLPREVVYEVECPDRELRVWNAYRIVHNNGEVTEDYWTGNAGMVKDHDDGQCYRFRCSSGAGSFDPTEFVVEVVVQGRVAVIK